MYAQINCGFPVYFGINIYNEKTNVSASMAPHADFPLALAFYLLGITLFRAPTQFTLCMAIAIRVMSNFIWFLIH